MKDWVQSSLKRSKSTKSRVLAIDKMQWMKRKDRLRLKGVSTTTAIMHSGEEEFNPYLGMSFWDNLYHLRLQGTLCDIQLCVKDEDDQVVAIPAHKIVLVASSKFFNNCMVSKDLLDMYNFDGLSVSNLQTVLNFMYRRISYASLQSNPQTAEAARILGIINHENHEGQPPLPVEPEYSATKTDIDFSGFMKYSGSKYLEDEKGKRMLVVKMTDPNHRSQTKGVKEWVAPPASSSQPTPTEAAYKIAPKRIYVENMTKALQKHNIFTRRSQKVTEMGMNVDESGDLSSKSTAEAVYVACENDPVEESGAQVPESIQEAVADMQMQQIVSTPDSQNRSLISFLTENENPQQSTVKMVEIEENVEQYSPMVKIKQEHQNDEEVQDNENLPTEEESPCFENVTLEEVTMSVLETSEEKGYGDKEDTQDMSASVENENQNENPTCDVINDEVVSDREEEVLLDESKADESKAIETSVIVNNVEKRICLDLPTPIRKSCRVRKGTIKEEDSEWVTPKVRRKTTVIVKTEELNTSSTTNDAVEVMMPNPNATRKTRQKKVEENHSPTVESGKDNNSENSDSGCDKMVKAGMALRRKKGNTVQKDEQNTKTPPPTRSLTRKQNQSISPTSKSQSIAENGDESLVKVKHEVIRVKVDEDTDKDSTPQDRTMVFVVKKPRKSSVLSDKEADKEESDMPMLVDPTISEGSALDDADSEANTTGVREIVDHDTKPINRWPCLKCHKLFKNANGLNLHMKWRHGGKIEREGTDPVECELCNRVMATFAALATHMKAKHEAVPNLACDMCDLGFPTRKKLKTHKINIHGTYSYSCTICNVGFKSREGWKIHMAKKHSEDDSNYMCSKCGKVFKMKHELRYHLNVTHAETRDFKCTLCPRAFKNKAMLKRHLQTYHSKTRNFECGECHARFKTQADMKKHHLLHFRDHKPLAVGPKSSQKEKKDPDHMAAKTIQCSMCDKAFVKEHQKAAHEKNVHMARESGQLYTCTVCNRSFNVKGYLIQHIKYHHRKKSFNCPRCHYSFTYQYMLKKHIPKCKGFPDTVKPFTCNTCGLGFNLKGNLTKHQQRPERCQKVNRAKMLADYVVVMPTGEEDPADSDIIYEEVPETFIELQVEEEQEVMTHSQISMDTLQASEALQQLQGGQQLQGVQQLQGGQLTRTVLGHSGEPLLIKSEDTGQTKKDVDNAPSHVVIGNSSYQLVNESESMDETVEYVSLETNDGEQVDENRLRSLLMGSDMSQDDIVVQIVETDGSQVEEMPATQQIYVQDGVEMVKTENMVQQGKGYMHMVQGEEVQVDGVHHLTEAEFAQLQQQGMVQVVQGEISADGEMVHLVQDGVTSEEVVTEEV